VSARGPEAPEEILAVIAAAVATARRRGLHNPVVSAVVSVADADPGPWVWSGRLRQMSARSAVQRRPHSTR